APHGGIFVLPVMGHPVLYLLSLGAGTALTAVLLGVWKRPCGGCDEGAADPPDKVGGSCT
ncbi:MAG: hypothetical protein IJT94_18875, partial [Oscillibacter sp.]|nr:hypothetical protein [Oscillibacter sp.]